MFEAFIRPSPRGIQRFLSRRQPCHGPRSIGSDIKAGKPNILSPCGFDMIGCGYIQRRDQGDPAWVSRKLGERKLLVQDSLRVQARTSYEEVILIGEKLQRSSMNIPKSVWQNSSYPTWGSPLSASKGAHYTVLPAAAPSRTS